MKPSRVAEVIEDLVETRWPVFLWGPPGVGKSSVVRQLAERRRLPILDIRAALLDPTDIRGIPAIVDGRAVWCPPSFLPSADTLAGILFFDELSSAPPLVQASLYQLTLDRRVGEYCLPEGWHVIAAGNRAEDRSISFRMPAALANRFIHVDFEVDYADWRDWAIRNYVHPLIVAFLAVRRELLHDMRNTDRGFPTPRSWEMVSDIVKKAFAVSKKDRTKSVSLGGVLDILSGIVGEGAAVEFIGFCNDSFSEEYFLQIIAAPDTCSLPTRLGELYALVSYLTARGGEPAAQNAAGALLSRLTPEMAVLLMNDMLKVAPGFVVNPGARRFMASNASLIVP